MVTTAHIPALPVDTDVLVVGAGPAGLTLAAELTRLGVAHVVIDRREGIRPGTRAAAVQPRTLECLERLDVVERLVEAGVRGSGFQVHDGERSLLRAAYDRLETAYPYMLLVSQQTTEEHLERRLHELGGVVHRGHRLLTAEPDHPGVTTTTATIAAPDGGVHAVRARYIVGADGVYSRVRELAGIGFPGEASEQLYALADFRIAPGASGAAAEAPTDTTFFLSPHGMLLVSPLADGLHRVVASVPPGTPAPTAEEVDALLAERDPRVGAPARIDELVAASTYRVQERVAERLSQGAYFLIGDAAHTHSPAGGQGMNTGIQDAVNLAGKLCAVLVGGAPAETLEAYHAERHPVAQKLVSFTAQIAQLALVRDPAEVRLRDDVIAAAAAVPGLADWLATRLAQLDIPLPPRLDIALPPLPLPASPEAAGTP